MIRHDGHPFIFFGMALFVGLLLTRLLAAAPSGLTGLALGALLACSVAGTLLTEGRVRDDFFAWNIRQTKANLAVAASPVANRQRLDAEQARLADEWRLDKVRDIVGEAALDEISCEQGIVLLNGFHWQPRPVFQSYTAYTPALLRQNAEFFRSQGAPEYLLLHLAPVDGRLGAMEDSQALLEILRRYEPVAAEKQFVLFRRVPPSEEVGAPVPEIVRRQTANFREDVSLEDLPGTLQLLSLRFVPSARGMVRRACFKRDELELEIRTASGHTLSRRLVPALAAEGFLINPLVDTTADFVRLYGPGDGDRVVSLRVTPASHDFRDEIEVTITACPRLACRTLEASFLEELLTGRGE